MTRVPLVDVAAQEAGVADEVLAAVAQVAKEGRFVLGHRVAAFERWLADACAAGHAVGVASGTDAIELGLRASGIGPGDTVVTPAYSFVAAAEAIAATGARPLFCDVDSTTWTASPQSVEQCLDRARRTERVRAIVPVDLFGACASIDGLCATARRHGLAVIEDAAQSLGARDEQGRPAGAAVQAACFSFFPTKSLGAWGDGGAVVTSDEGLAARVRRLRAHGAVAPYVHAELGRNSRLDELQAAVLQVKARHFEAWLQARKRLAATYLRELEGLPLRMPYVPREPAVHAWHAFVVRVPKARDALAEWLAERGVETRVYYPVPLHEQGSFRAMHDGADLPNASDACRTALALPLFAAMTEAQQAYVIEQVARFFR